MNIAVVGAGPAGLTAAYVLTQAGLAVDVYEASDAVGGLAKSLSLWGQTVDLGPHRFFSHNKRVNELWLEVVGADYRMVRRLTRILYRGKFFQYPLEPWNALLRCLASYGWELCSPPAATRSRRSAAAARSAKSTACSHAAATGGETFESWVQHQFGKRLFEIFFKTYSEKLWGLPCNRLDADFAAQRIKTLSLGAALRGALSKTEQEQLRGHHWRMETQASHFTLDVSNLARGRKPPHARRPRGMEKVRVNGHPHH